MNYELAMALCKLFEGFRAKPYVCPAGVPTIGYGSTRYGDGTPVTLQDPPISQEMALSILNKDLNKVFGPGVIRQCPELLAMALKSDQWGPLNAIVDFAYNLGVGRLQTSTLKRKINARDWEGVKYELMKWTRGGGRVLPGLVKRRSAECQLI